MTVLRLTEEGHLVLPDDMRRVLGLAAGDAVEVELEGRGLRLCVPALQSTGPGGTDIGPWLGRGGSFRTAAEIDGHVDALREEWD